MHLHGRHWTRREIEARSSQLEQIGGIRRFQLTEGREKGVELIQVRTGAGLSFYVSPSRGMDIGLTEFGGVPLSWLSVNGTVNPAFYDPGATGMKWLRTAAGGLLITCGLTQVGPPCVDNGEIIGLHGHAHHLPGRQVVAEGHWQEDEYLMQIRGLVEETEMFGDHLQLTREIDCQMGLNRLTIRDVVENLSFHPSPHMILYHFNFGFPLMSEETRVLFPSQKVTPREEGTPVEGYDQWQAPQPDYKEHVYYHQDLITELDATTGRECATAVIENPVFPMADGSTCALSVSLSWATENLPYLIEWKMPGADVHALGIEPANCPVVGRVAAREAGDLVMLAPGESRVYELELDISTDR